MNVDFLISKESQMFANDLCERVNVVVYDALRGASDQKRQL